MRNKIQTYVVALGMAALPAGTAMAKRNIHFKDMANHDRAISEYRRIPSVTDAVFNAQKQAPKYTLEKDVALTPVKSKGAPGVALLDFDNDGDLDIYVTNGPGRANSLLSNQLRETGRFSFVDVAERAHAGLRDQDSTGVCFGDIDNDGDLDLYVLGRGEPNHLLENIGGGRFRDSTDRAHLGAGSFGHTSCAMGDINGDGLLDIMVSNTFDWSNQIPLLAVPFAKNHYNQLFVNRGHNGFEDVSQSSGILKLKQTESKYDGMPVISWTSAMVDYDLDGDTDIIIASGQGAYPRASRGGINRSAIHIMQNDGSGHFTDVSDVAGTRDIPGNWMGLAFGDFNHDGHLDIWGSNFGDWAVLGVPPIAATYSRGLTASRWFLGHADGTFSDPGVGALQATPFGWGASAVDYDNDGHTDIAFVGGFDLGPYVDMSNAGTILRNDGHANFSYERAAVSAALARRQAQGMASGDLNGDGFVDFVAANSFDVPESVALQPYDVSYQSPFDPPVAAFAPTFTMTEPLVWTFNKIEYAEGSLSVELNSGDNGAHSVTVHAVGTIGLTDGGRTNRSAIGAMVTVTPEGLPAAMHPVVSGSSYESQDALDYAFGMGRADSATVDVLWPGKVRNRLYGVRPDEKVTFPEIPCSYDAPELWGYFECVTGSLHDLHHRRVINREESTRLFVSALAAFFDARHKH